jgi:uncharacterized protein (UPF0261 family)
LRASLDPRVRIVDVDAHINDPEFARALVTVYMEIRHRADT